jgi:molybdopterin-guanine dinucleotide biosynthesis protein A
MNACRSATADEVPIAGERYPVTSVQSGDDADKQSVTGIVVAGGSSRRLGQDKRRLRLWGADGPTLLEHTLAQLAPLCAELLVVLNDPQAWPELPARCMSDSYPDGGALGGIYTGLAAMTHRYALVVAADMPLLRHELLAAMLAYPRTYDALVPRSLRPGAVRNAAGLEPLHAIYSRACCAPLRRMLDQGQRRIADFLADVRMLTVEPAMIARYDPAGQAFLNINTPDDLATARRVIATE